MIKIIIKVQKKYDRVVFNLEKECWKDESPRSVQSNFEKL